MTEFSALIAVMFAFNFVLTLAAAWFSFSTMDRLAIFEQELKQFHAEFKQLRATATKQDASS